MFGLLNIIASISGPLCLTFQAFILFYFFFFIFYLFFFLVKLIGVSCIFIFVRSVFKLIISKSLYYVLFKISATMVFVR